MEICPLFIWSSDKIMIGYFMLLENDSDQNSVHNFIFV